MRRTAQLRSLLLATAPRLQGWGDAPRGGGWGDDAESTGSWGAAAAGGGGNWAQQPPAGGGGGAPGGGAGAWGAGGDAGAAPVAPAGGDAGGWGAGGGAPAPDAGAGGWGAGAPAAPAAAGGWDAGGGAPAGGGAGGWGAGGGAPAPAAARWGGNDAGWGGAPTGAGGGPRGRGMRGGLGGGGRGRGMGRGGQEFGGWGQPQTGAEDQWGAAPPSFNPPVRRVDPLTLTAVEVEIDGVRKLVGQRIVVTGVSDDTTWHVLKDHLRQCGEVTFCKIYSGGRAAVEFASPEESAKCITELQGSELEGATVFLREDREDTVLINTRRKIRDAGDAKRRAEKEARAKEEEEKAIAQQAAAAAAAGGAAAAPPASE